MPEVSARSHEEPRDPLDAFNAGDPSLPGGDDPDLGGGDVGVDGEQSEASAEVQAEQERVDAEAREAGWVPKEDWNGPAEKWKPAKDFLDFRDHVLPTVQKENRELKARLARLEQAHREREENIRQAEARIERDSIKRQLREARAEGNDELVDQLEDKLFDMRSPTPARQSNNEMPPETKAAWDAFRSDNPWVEKDQGLGGAFARQLKLIIDTRTANSPEEAFTIAKDEVRRMYPERFKPRQSTAMAEGGGSRGTPPPANGRSWNNLTPAARSAFDDQLDQMNLTGKAREESKARILRDCDAEHFRRA
jgi:hypothetical protein